MNKTKVSFLEPNLALVQTPCGDDYIIQFSGMMNYAMDSQSDDFKFTEFFGSLFDKYYHGDDSVIFGEINRQLLINRCNSIFGYEKEKIKQRLILGERIQELRKQKGMEVWELASEAGIEPANLKRIEMGKYAPTFDVLCHIAYALGMKIDFVELNPDNNELNSDVRP